MNHKITCFVQITILFLLLSTSGCFEQISHFDIDPVVRRANPYLAQIDVDDDSLRQYALPIINDCPTDDIACQVHAIYRHVVENYSYIADPEGEEIIQSAHETIEIKGGDCEDLSILLISLLQNIGITSHLVLTDNHAYALALDIDSNSLWPYIEESLLNEVEKDNEEKIIQFFSDTLSLHRKTTWYYGGEGGNLSKSFESLTLSFKISSSHPIDLYVVPSIDDFYAFTNETSFRHVSSCQQLQKMSFTGTCTLETYGGILLYNDGIQSVSVSIEIEQYLKPSFYSLFENKTISTYVIKGRESVVLDPTAGTYGYPGYDANVTGEKIAIDPVTKEYIYLD
ncbi:MAG: transglutaminase domain-containing protein [Candidatus Thermoplasmatota archaeon]|nr:transglutaminase domain-containing protein [Candidatus Thermoplasmatota archaeon]